MSGDAYEALASLIERELELVADRDFDGLRELASERAALVRSMPPTPPASARDALLRCDGLQKRVGAELARVREAILLELRQVRLAHRTAAGYRPAQVHTPSITATA
jgi:hypothetical protein